MAPAQTSERERRIDIPTFTHALSGFVERTPRLCVRLGNLETRYFHDKLAPLAIERPIFICGLARSGSTILLELLSTHADSATHTYRDFPLLHIPLWWNAVLDRASHNHAPAVERAHMDGLMVTPQSPEAMEEPIWTTFFPRAHDPSVSNVLDDETSNQAFERFYRDHVRKILLLRHGRRYLSKGNYNLTRLEYLMKLFPDARFVIPVREPRAHIASLVKQHRLFCREESRDTRILAYMRRANHFEFGLDRRPINPNATGQIQAILKLWRQGEEVRGWARYWATLYAWTLETLRRNFRLAEASLVVRYEDLCRRPQEALAQVCQHCQIRFGEEELGRLAARLRFPTYYQPEFTQEEMRVIEEETSAISRELGYEG